MKIINNWGDVANIPDEIIPEEMAESAYDEFVSVPDDLTLRMTWRIVVYGKGGKVIAQVSCNHEPSESYLMYLLVKHGKSEGFSDDNYVSVTKGYELGYNTLNPELWGRLLDAKKGNKDD